MEIPAEIVRMNEYLGRDYGYQDGNPSLPRYRMVWSEDQFEKRWSKHNYFGVELLNPEVVERPKYRQWIHGKWVLEVLIPTLPGVQTDRVLPFDYEPFWVFGDNGTPPIPIYGALTFLIDTRHYNMGMAPEYLADKDPRKEKDYLLKKKQDLEEIKQYLFGDETKVSDALAYGHGVSLANTSKDVVN